MKRYILILLVTFAFLKIVQGQLPLSYEVRSTMDLYELNKMVSGNSTVTLSEKDIEGSAWLNESFESGSIYTVQKLNYAEIPLRYNIFNDNLEFKTPEGEILALADPNIVERAVIGQIQLVYSFYYQGNRQKNGFFVVLTEGKASLYSKPSVMFKDATKPAAYKEAEPARFVRKQDELYIKIGNNPAMIINGKKSLVEVFPDNQEKIENFINKNKIKISKPESLREVIGYYNSL